MILPSLTLHMDADGRLVLLAGPERATWPALRSATVEKTGFQEPAR